MVSARDRANPRLGANCLLCSLYRERAPLAQAGSRLGPPWGAPGNLALLGVDRFESATPGRGPESLWKLRGLPTPRSPKRLT